MGECICNTCKNLKAVFNETGAVDEYECEFGFPSDDCTVCDGEGCDNTCANYESDESEAYVKVNCAKCGKELEQLCTDKEEGNVYCASCYLD